MNKSESIKELATALAAAQAEMENASKTSVNPHFRSKYADLAEILDTVRPVLAKHGLAIAQFPSLDEGIVSVESILMHSSGEWISGTISVPIGKVDAQGVGSATTYARRYSLAALAGIAQADDDGNAADQAAPAKAVDDGAAAAYEAEHLQALRSAAVDGSKSLATAFAALPASPHKAAFWTKHRESLKTAATKADQVS